MRSDSSLLRRQMALAIPTLAFLTLAYVFIATSGTFTDYVLPKTALYDEMARGFSSGHLYIERGPPPALLAKPDPFDASNLRLWSWDASLYNGRYYLYWGPAPALLTLGFKALTGYEGIVTDLSLTLAFMLGRLYAGAAIILGLAHFAQMRQPPWLVSLIIAVFAMSSPIPFTLARPYIYEACLAGGQCFLFGGLAFAFWGLLRPSRRPLKLLAAGILWALAIGSRVTMCIPIPLIIVITLAVAWLRSKSSFRQIVQDGLAMGVPVAASLAAYALYNQARFDSVTEFGVRWQLTTQKFETDASFIIPNLFSYLFGPPEWYCRFPFVSAIMYRRLSPLINWPPGYEHFEFLAGFMILSGWCWLILVAFGRVVARIGRYLRKPEATFVTAVPTPELWVGCCSVAILLAMIPVLGLWEASMRYPGDSMGGLILLCSLAAFWLRQYADASPRRWVRMGILSTLVLLGVHSCVLGALSSFDTYSHQFLGRNPVMYRYLQERLSFCPT